MVAVLFCRKLREVIASHLTQKNKYLMVLLNWMSVISIVYEEKELHYGIESFWNQAKRVLRKYNGVLKEPFALFLKECEFRFNDGAPNSN